jgi:hypothetical protein
VGDNSYGQCSIYNWVSITQVAAGFLHTVGLKSDGTVVAAGDNTYGQCDVSSWTGITQVAAGFLHTVGLKSDGTVVAAGDNTYGQCNVSSWTGITQVAAGGWHTVGLNPYGTVVAVGDNAFGQCNLFDWNLGIASTTPTPTPAPGGSTPVTGTIREVNGNILSGVTITLDGTSSVVSDQSGQYEIMATSIGNHTIVAHKDGFRDRTQTVNIVGLGQEFAVTCNFQGQNGLIPNAPDMWYALDCVNLWLYPPNPDTGLDMWTALDVINAWLYPVQ